MDVEGMMDVIIGRSFHMTWLDIILNKKLQKIERCSSEGWNSDDIDNKDNKDRKIIYKTYKKEATKSSMRTFPTENSSELWSLRIENPTSIFNDIFLREDLDDDLFLQKSQQKIWSFRIAALLSTIFSYRKVINDNLLV